MLFPSKPKKNNFHSFLKLNQYFKINYFLKYKNYFILVTIFMTSLFCLTPSSSWGKEQEYLTVGSELDYPPYALVNEKGEADGFSVDLIKAVAEVMGVEIQFQVGPWNQVFNALKDDKIDVLPLVANSEERDKIFDFGRPHMITYGAVFVRKGTPKIQSLSDIKDRQILVMNSDWTHEFLVEQGFDNNLIIKPDLATVLRLLASKKYDYAFVPMLPGLLMANDLKLDHLTVTWKSTQVEGRKFSFAVHEGNTDLLFRLNQGLEIVEATGKYDEIYDKWFGKVDPQGMELEEVIQLIIQVGIIAALISGSILIWSLSLKQQVNIRTYKLQQEIIERREIEKALRQSEAREREKAQSLAKTLEELEDTQAKLTQYIKKLKTTQLQVIQSEKMSALGQMMAGINHEINNPLGFLAGNLNQLEEYLQDLIEYLNLYQQQFPHPGSGIEQKAEEIEIDYILEDLPEMFIAMQVGIKRIQDISTSMRIFSRGDQDQKVLFNLHEGIDSTLLILKHRLKASDQRPEIEVIRHYGNIPDLTGFPGQLNQVFMNIIANGIDVFDEMSTVSLNQGMNNPNYQITILTEVDELKQQIIIKIKDNGLGMSEVVKAQIFNHLFTTKAVGKGTGLGLSIAYQIIHENHGGTIICHSKIGQGTEFVITLPINSISQNPEEISHKQEQSQWV
jgi:signal transduction histidine kinase